MNIGERFLCSRCMREIEIEDECPFCGYVPGAYSDDIEMSYIEEGTLLHEGRYQLGTVIGRGGFGVTYAAWDLVLDMPVAIKEYFPRNYACRDITESDNLVIKPETKNYFQYGLSTFIREARILATLQNIKTVVTVYDCFEENTTSYIVMEYVRGDDLFHYCGKQKISPEKLFKLLRPLIDDLIRVHQSGVLHRDISPYNLLVQEDGNIKLIDFGAATNLDKNETNASLNRSFAAPEQYDINGEQGAWTDVYALAATIYSLVLGENVPDALSRLESDTIKSLKKSKAIILPYRRRAIENALILSTKKRTQSVEEFRAALYNLPRPLRTRREKIAFASKIALSVALFFSLCLFIIYSIEIELDTQVQLAGKAYFKHDTYAAYTLSASYKEQEFGRYKFLKNEERASYWYQWAAEHGHTGAMVEYAYDLQTREEAEHNMDQVIALYKNAIAAGDAMAMNNLGVIYLESEEFESKKEQAIQYFEESAKLGNTLAMVNLGEIYRLGLAGKTDEEKAFRYYQKAAELGDSQGMFLLGCSYGDGIGVEKDDLLYFRWCYEAAYEGNSDAMGRIGRFYINGDLGFKDEVRGAEWIWDASRAGSVEATYAYATLLRDGIGVEKNPIKASEYMLKALEMGHKDAEKEIEKMQESKYGVFAEE